MKNTNKILTAIIAAITALCITNSNNCEYTGYPSGRGSSKHADYFQDKAAREYKAAHSNDPATQGSIDWLSDMIIRLTDQNREQIKALEKRVNNLERSRK